MIGDAQLMPLLERLREELPGLALFDAHTHIGSNDPDGYRCSAADLVDALELAGARGVVFPMHEPDGYGEANDMVLREAAVSDGRLVAFCRLDPGADPLAEAERCIAAGARGIKLHPRAEGFALDHPALQEVFAFANEGRLPVLCHAGRGIPALGLHAVEACRRSPGMRLILAHAGISDLSWIAGEAAELPNLLFDTSWWSASDIQALLALVAPGQILFASDTPYGSPTLAAVLTLRHALQVGLDERQLRALTGGQLERLLAGDELLDVGPAPGPGALARDPLMDRVYAFLMSALGQMFVGVEPSETLALVTLACDVAPAAPQAEACRWVRELLAARATLPPPDPRRRRRFPPGIQLVIAAAAVARTPDVPLPKEVFPMAGAG